MAVLVQSHLDRILELAQTAAQATFEKFTTASPSMGVR
jgi:hypothetical protein